MSINSAKGTAIVGILLVVLAAFTIFDAFADDSAQEKRDACLTDSFEALTEALEARSILLQNDSNSVNQVITAISQAKNDADVQAAFREYNLTRVESAKVRAANPIPEYPSGKCA